MKEIAFTTEQRNLLQECSKNRLDESLKTIDKNDEQNYNFCIKPLISALDKVSTLDTAF
jgi:hypothetical protein